MAAIKVDISDSRYSVGAIPKPKTDMQGQQRMDRLTGVGLFVTQLIELSDEGAQLLNVTTAGCPDVGQGAEVRPVKLIAIPWQQGDRSGVSFKADAIEHATAPTGKGAGS